MNEQKIEELKNALREVMEILVTRGAPLSEDLKLVLADVMQHVASRIQELRQETPVEGLAPTTPEVEQGPYPSSNINGFKYDPKSQKLLVKFQGKYPAQNGPIYGYEGVPSYIYDIFRRGAVAPKTSGKNRWHTWKKGVTPSLGASMAALVKNGGYPYQRLT